MLVSEVGVFTTTLTGIFSIPAGARTIDLNNKGAGSATILGNTPQLGGVTKGAVTIASAEAYSFGDLGKPYPVIIIDATGTSVDIIANY